MQKIHLLTATNSIAVPPATAAQMLVTKHSLTLEKLTRDYANLSRPESEFQEKILTEASSYSRAGTSRMKSRSLTLSAR